MIIGYARVSSIGQSLELQQDKLQICDKVFCEKQSGTNSKRAELDACLDFVREGDTLVITRLDRLARSTLHLCQIAERLEKKQVTLKVLDQNIDTSDATGRLLFNMLGAIGQFETEIRAERQLEGVKKAKELGTKFGAEKSLDANAILELKAKREAGKLIRELQEEYKISRTSVYRYLRE